MNRGMDVDPILDFLGPTGRYQLFQMMLIAIGAICAQNQLFDIIFIGKDVPFRCAPPPANITTAWHPDISPVMDNSSTIRYEQCHIIVTTNITNEIKEKSYDCIFGYEFEWDKDLSFVSEFELVCDRYVLVGLSQTILVLGQGIGVFFSSIISDKFGRKPVLIGSQLGLLVIGMAIGASPSYPVLTVFKGLVGVFQQGVMAGISTMGIELFSRKRRSLCALIINLWWAVGGCSMAPIAYLLRHHSWRVLQYTLSGISALVVLLQVVLMDDSLRWLVANGKKKKALEVLKRAANANKKDLESVLSAQHFCRDQHLDIQQQNEHSAKDVDTKSSCIPPTVDNGHEQLMIDKQGQMGLQLEATRSLTFLDMFRHKTLRFNAIISCFAWFTIAFVVFTLYLMSTSYAGDPYLNYFLAALMEAPPAIILFFGVDRLGRKRTVQGLFTLAGIGCIASAISLMFEDNPTLAKMSAVFAMAGMVGGSGAFGGLFFYTPEYFPTNLRSQALGMGSTVGRFGGMIAPFMKNLALIVMWGPGIITGSLCVLVVICLHFLPETKGRQLPTTIEDIDAWYLDKKKQATKENGDLPQ